MGTPAVSEFVTGRSDAPDIIVATVARRWENAENHHALAIVATMERTSVDLEAC